MRCFCPVHIGPFGRKTDLNTRNVTLFPFPLGLILLSTFWILLNCVHSIRTAEFQHNQTPDYCVVWHEQDKVIVASGYRLFLVHMTENQSLMLPLLEWPVDGVVTMPTWEINQERCNAAIRWVAQLMENTFEVCGSVNDRIHCHVYKVNGTVWVWISTHATIFHANFHSLVHSLVDGYSLLAYSPLKGGKSVVQLRTIQLQISSVTSNKSEFPLDKMNWWNTVLETSNHNQMQLTVSHKVRFHHVISAPGRRYLIFQEPGLESYYQQALWTQQTAEVIYTRIARVCTGDPGLRSPKDGRLLFTSYFKARLVCRIRPTDLKHSARFNRASYNYEVSELHYNHPIVFTQSFITDYQSEPVIYGLFSFVDPESVDRMPRELLRRGMETFGPLALCLYRLADIDTVIRSSDLVQLVPTGTRSAGAAQPADSMRYNVSGTSIYMSSIPTDRRVARIRRIHSDHLESITDCPGPSVSNRRLALEAPLLATPVLPHTGQAIGLIQPSSPIAAVIIDPRSFANSPVMHSTDKLSDSHRLRLLYISTRSGEVFKLLLTLPDLRQVNKTNVFGTQSTMDSTTESLSLLASGNIHVIQKLLQLPEQRPILSLHLVQYDSSGNFITLPTPVNSPLDFKTKLQLYIINGPNLIRFPVQNCSQAVTCRQCVALRDPECYWNPSNGVCTTEGPGIQNVWTGTDQECEKMDQTIKTVANIAPNTADPETVSLRQTTDITNSPLAAKHENNAKRMEHLTNPVHSSVVFTIKFDHWLLLWFACVLLMLVCIVLTWCLTRCYYHRKFGSASQKKTKTKKAQTGFVFSQTTTAGRQVPNHFCARILDKETEEQDNRTSLRTDSTGKPVDVFCPCTLLSDSSSRRDSEKFAELKTAFYSPPSLTSPTTPLPLPPSPPASSVTMRSFLPQRLLYPDSGVNPKLGSNQFQLKSEKSSLHMGTVCLNNDLHSDGDPDFPDSSCDQCTETVDLHLS